MTDAPQPLAPLHLPLSRGEATALLSLADLGRVYLDVDPRALAAPGQRDNARRASATTPAGPSAASATSPEPGPEPMTSSAASGAPTVRARETRKPEFPATVHAYTDVLRELVEGAQTPEALAQTTDRVPSNVRRDVHKLRDAGVIEPVGDGKWSLTDKGRRWVAGIEIAEGRGAQAASARGASVSASPTWPLDKIVRNPANRDVDPASIPAMADSLVAQGQLQPITLTPVREDGTRMLLIGERRWLGAKLAAEQGRLSDSLKAGLRFEEREATPPEAIAITVVENVERQEIPPLELAFLLRDYADAAGEDGKPLDGKSVAERLGLGVRDVQDKIRIARQATPEAIAAYREHGSWDRLRDSVTEKKAAANGPEWANGTPYAPRFDRHKPIMTAGDFAPDLPWPEEGWKGLADAYDPATVETFAMPMGAHGFPLAQIQIAPLRGGHGWVYAAGYSAAGLGHHERLEGVRRNEEAFPDRETAIAAGVDLIRDSLGRMVKFKLPASIDAWLRLMESEDQRPAPTTAGEPAAADDPLVVNGVRYPNATRANEARRAAGLLPTHANHGGGSASRPATDAVTESAIRKVTEYVANVRDLAVLTTERGYVRARLALIEIAHKIGTQRRPLDPINPAEWTGDVDQDFLTHGCTCGAHWLDPHVQALIQLGAARVVQIPGGCPPMLALTAAGLQYLQSYGCALPITGAALSVDQQIAGAPATPPGAALAYATACLAKEAAAPPEAGPSVPDDDPTAASAASDDPWDRTPEQIAEAEALLSRVLAFTCEDAEAEPTEGDTAAGLLALLGLRPAATITDQGGIKLETAEGLEVELITVDAAGHHPDEYAKALAAMVAWAFERAIGGEAS